MYGQQYPRPYIVGATQNHRYGWTVGAEIDQPAPAVPTGNIRSGNVVSPVAGERVRGVFTVTNIGDAPITITSIIGNMVVPGTRITQARMMEPFNTVLPMVIQPGTSTVVAMQMPLGIATQADLPSVLDVIWEIFTSEAGVFVFGTTGSVNVPPASFGVDMGTVTYARIG